MDRRVREFRKLARRRGGRLYPAELKQLAVGYARDAMAAGSSVWPVSKELGVWFQTLQAWMREAPSFRPVEVESAAPEPSGSGLRIRTRSGHEVTGLAVADAVVLLRGLEGQ